MVNSKSVLVGLLLLSLSVPASAQDVVSPEPLSEPRVSRLLVAGLGSFLVLKGAEVYTTVDALDRGAGVEGNPLMAPFAQHPVALTAVVMGTSAAISYYLIRVHRHHPNVATGLSWVLAGVTGTLVAHNARVGQGLAHPR